jgi:SAM-dependent methyltransferase
MDKEKTWDEVWEKTEELPWFRRKSHEFIKTGLKRILTWTKISKNARIVDVGCGSGTTLYFFRDLGYRNSIGIDSSQHSIRTCEKLFGFKRGKDVFLTDATKTGFRSGEFDLVFSNGLLEHFANFTPLVKEMCRISKQHILLFQPDPTSLVARFLSFSRKLGFFSGPKEYFYDKRVYQNTFSKFSFKLIHSGKYGLGGMYLLFG